MQLPESQPSLTIPQILKGYDTAISAAVGPTAWCDKWSLTALAVSPEHQGKGIGKALLKACEEQVSFCRFHNLFV
jgi:ribosomal protein S18 acetylase RimI-like enzyme